MALPDTILAQPALTGHNPPHKSSGGSYYAVVFDATNTHVEVWKSTAPGSSAWAEQDSTNHINRDCDTLASIPDGDILHIVTLNSTDWLIKYHRFNMSTDAWDTTNSDNTVADISGMSAPTNAVAAFVSIALTTVSGQELVIAGPGLTDADMGTSYDRVDYWYGGKTGTPSWTGPTSLDASVAARFESNAQLKIGTNNSVHAFWGTSTFGILRHSNIDGRTITLPTTLSTLQESSLGSDRNDVHGISNIATYDDAGTQRILFHRVSNGAQAFTSTEDGSGDLGALTAITTGFSVYGPGVERVASVVANGSDVYIVFSKAFDPDGQDLFYSKTTDNGANWDTATEHRDAVTINLVSVEILDTDTLALLYDDGGSMKYDEISISAGDSLFADNVQSNSQVSTPALGQTHAITADNVESASQVSSPAISQVHVLLANNVESSSQVSAPTVELITPLTADNVEGASETTAPSLGQTHDLTSTSVESASELTTPAVGQVHALTAADVESASEITSPTLAEGSHDLLADNVQSASETTTPALEHIHVLAANDLESASETSAPAVGQTHGLTAADVESQSQVSTPTVSESNILLADNVESASQITVPAISQVHVLTNTGAEAATETGTPAISQEHSLLASGVQSASETTAPTLTEGSHSLLADNAESASEVTTPTVGQSHALTANNIESGSESTSPAVGQEHALVAGDIESASETATPAISESHALQSDSVESASETSAPTLAQVHHIFGDDVQSASQTSAPALGQEHILAADDVQAASETTQPVLVQIVFGLETPAIRTYIPGQETRSSAIPAENRGFVVAKETRSSAIPAENRGFVVAKETRSSAA